MESNQDIQNLSLAIQKLIQAKQSKGGDDDFMEDDEQQLLLSRLLSQMKSLKEDDELKQSEGLIEQKEKEYAVGGKAEAKNENAGQGDNEHSKISLEEIAKELRAVRRQNTITHWLLSSLIVLMVVWQLSEVSLILKVKDGIRHPFRSLGSMLVGMLRSPGTSSEDADKPFLSTKKQNDNLVEVPHMELPQLKMPELPHVDFPDIGLKP
ncbi:hypothetical protein SLA2020_130880 [Shorea laevis]